MRRKLEERKFGGEGRLGERCVEAVEVRRVGFEKERM